MAGVASLLVEASGSNPDRSMDTMQKEEKIGAVLLIMALLSLTVIYFALPTSSDAERLSDASQLDDEVYAEGLVMDKRMTRIGGHLILSVKMDVGVIDVFVHRDSDAAEIDEKVREGDRIRAYGILSEFRGERQIRIQSGGDIIVL